VWCGVAETAMKSDRHYLATVNYVHHNPVKHGYVANWHDWPFGNAREYLDVVGRDEAERVWKEYPIGSFGAGWDD
jgi:putative transposase